MVSRTIVVMLGPILAAGSQLGPLSQNAWAGTEKVLYTFQGGSDAASPTGPIVFDTNTSIYGTTQSGAAVCGSYTCGAVYKLTKSGSHWTENLLYVFTGGVDGFSPEAGVVFDKNGNILGTSYGGGNPGCYFNVGCGAVFELIPSGGGWDETTLYTFNSNTDGGASQSPLVIDNAGNLYGTNYWGGLVGSDFGNGSVFELSPSGGSWTEKTLYLFTDGIDGANPRSNQLLYKGNLYGTTTKAGANGAGVVFELQHSKKTGWTNNTLYTFTGGSDGEDPGAGIVFDDSGNIYGTTAYGGSGSGTVFKLSPSGSGWTFSTLYTFTGGSDGGTPFAPVVLDKSGNIYGTTVSGGLGYGGVFELVNAGGTYSYNNIYSFTGGADGANPVAPVVLKGKKLYGTANGGGIGYGVVFQITP